MSEAVQLEMIRGGIDLLVPLLSALLLYFVGKYLTDRYSEHKKQSELALVRESQLAQKRRELQLEAAGRFYELYGEFFAIWKEWSAAKAGKIVTTTPPTARHSLYQRACQAEGMMEAVLVRIVSEFCLDGAAIATLGKFRQAYQTLREAIREDQDLGWNRCDHPGYLAFKQLATGVASLLAQPGSTELPTSNKSTGILLEVTDNKWETTWTR